MFKCFDNNQLQNEILKCDQCNIPFNAYVQPRFLPCFETICFTCVNKIEKEVINKKFKCSVCFEDHFITDIGFAVNKKMYAL